MELLERAWNFQYALVPCAAAYIVFDLPIIFRRITRKLYVPVYFSFFPFGHSDELYARYFDEDHYYVVGGPIPQEERGNTQIKIIWVSVLSLVLTMAISPFLGALFSHYVLSDEQFRQFFWTLALVKAVLLLMSLYDLHNTYKITNVVPLSYLIVIYLAYWGALLVFLDRAKVWIDAKAAQGGLPTVLGGVIDFLVFEVGIGIIIVALLGFLIPWRLTQAYKSTTNE